MTLKIDKKPNEFQCCPKRDLLFVARMPQWKASNRVFYTYQTEYGHFCQRKNHSMPQTCGQSEVLTLLFKFSTFIFRCYPSLNRKCSPLLFMLKVTHIHQMRSRSFIFCHILQAVIRLAFDQGDLGPGCDREFYATPLILSACLLLTNNSVNYILLLLSYHNNQPGWS